MKKHILILTALLSTLFIQAQTISCSSFCVTNIYNDSVQTQVSIQMIDSGFVNYPYVMAILDQNGNTLSAGSMFYFGQIGETTQDYPSSLSNTDWSNFTGTVIFVYDNDTCSLNYPCDLLNSPEDDLYLSFTAFPNPATTFINLNSIDLPTYITFYSTQGQQIKRMYVESEKQSMAIQDLSAGTYFLVSERSNSKPYLLIKR